MQGQAPARRRLYRSRPETRYTLRMTAPDLATLRAAFAGRLLTDAGDMAPFLTDWRGRSRQSLAHILREPLLERAIGVVYRPETEFLSHYFEAVLADQFDAFVWFEHSNAVTPLGHEKPHGAPETYPFGL